MYLVSILLMFNSVVATIHPEARRATFNSSDSVVFHQPLQGLKALLPSTFSIHFTFLHYMLRADNLVSCVVIPNELRLELRV
jgi:hypothetical protein